MENLLIPGYTKRIPLKKNNYFLGLWCHKFTPQNIELNFEKKNTFKYHWEDRKKLSKDFNYLQSLNEKIIKKLAKVLNKIHSIDRSENYWRSICYPWLVIYTASLYDKYETYRLFLKKYKKKKFAFYKLEIEDEIRLNNNSNNFFNKASSNHQWNHFIFQKIFEYLKNKKIKALNKKNIFKNINLKPKTKSGLYFNNIRKKIILKNALRVNKILFEDFHFPRNEFLKINANNLLIPTKLKNFFEYNGKNFSRNETIRNLLSRHFKKENKINFYNFILENISKDLPMSYVEDFSDIRNQASSLPNKKKTIFTMHSIHNNDFFRIYVAEAMLKGSKLIISDHGGGLRKNLSMLEKNYYKKIATKRISWSKQLDKNFYLNLSPTIPIIKKKPKTEINENGFLTVVHYECSRYMTRVQSIPFLSDEIRNLRYLKKFLKNLKINIRNKTKYRLKEKSSINAQKIISNTFGRKIISKPSKKNSFHKALSESKLIVLTYPTTSFSEAMYLNVPSILICDSKTWEFNKLSLKIFNILVKNKIAFKNYEQANKHINQTWDNLGLWWKNKKTQSARRYYLKNFFNVKTNWYNQWQDYIKKIRTSK